MNPILGPTAKPLILAAFVSNVYNILYLDSEKNVFLTAKNYMRFSFFSRSADAHPVILNPNRFLHA